MKQIPILFSTPMVQALLDGRKTQTRRIIKHQPTIDPLTGDWLSKNLSGDEEVNPIEDWIESQLKYFTKCKVGDVMWVRETWQYVEFGCEPEEQGYVYKASENGKNWQDNDPDWKWKPSIFMPKAACRIWLEITDVRVERLQSISANDCYFEGIKYTGCRAGHGRMAMYMNYLTNKYEFWKEQDSYFSLWDSINGVGSHKANPWLWVIEFKRIEKP